MKEEKFALFTLLMNFKVRIHGLKSEAALAVSVSGHVLDSRFKKISIQLDLN